MNRQQQRRRQSEAQAASMDPVAISLAIWLGLAVTLAGLTRLAQAIPTPANDAGPAMVTVY